MRLSNGEIKLPLNLQLLHVTYSTS